MKRYMERFMKWYKEEGRDYLALTLICFFGSLIGFLAGCKVIGIW